MEMKDLSKERADEILKELAYRKYVGGTAFAIASKGGDVSGNAYSCTDNSCSGGGGGPGNSFACDDCNCSNPNGDPDTAGNTGACGDVYCT